MIKSLPACLATVLLLLTIAAPAQAGPLRRDAVSVRMDAYIGTKPDATPAEVKWTVSLKGEPYEVFVTKLVVLTGSIAYFDIINRLQPYSTALTVVGEDDQLDRFATAPAGQKISVTGFMQLGGGARYLMVSSVDYVDSPPTTATPVETTGAPK